MSHLIKNGGKLFTTDDEQIVLGKLIHWGIGQHGGLIIRSIANHEGIYT